MASPSSSNLRSAMQATMHAFLKSFETAVRTRDASHLSSALSPDCTRLLRPMSMLKALNMPVDVAEGNAAYEERMQMELDCDESVRCTILNETIDVEGLKGTMHVEHYMKLYGKDEFLLEFVWMVEFVADGSKIKKIVEFCDSVECLRYVPLLMEVAKDRGLVPQQ